MIRFNPHDASVLARIAQYDSLPANTWEKELDSLSQDARSVGLVLLNQSPPSSPEVAETVQALATWVHNNRAYRQALPNLVSETSQVVDLAA
jgi:hypothetical protein